MVGDTWEKKVAIKYYDKLYKEYCLADLSRHRESKIGMRWRTQKEVFSGKGQFTCGNIACDVREELSSYEVPFSYKEDAQDKMALVKLRCCPACALKVRTPPPPPSFLPPLSSFISRS
jgi:protein FRA10AC1